MKKLQNKIKNLRIKLGEIRSDIFFQSLPDKQKKNFYEALKNINDFEDFIIINYIIKNEKTKTN